MLGIDLGGTAIKSALVDVNGIASEQLSTPTPQKDPEGIASIRALAEIIQGYQEKHELLGVGLAIPGLVDPANGISLFSGTLGWRNLEIITKLSELVSVKVALEHDVSAIGLAEAKIGGAAGADSAVVVGIGTALAASVIIGGSVYHPHPAIGELGHTPTKNSRPCVCGLTGCLEMTASGGALSRNYQALTGESINAVEIFKRSTDGEANAVELVDEFMDVLTTSFVFVAALIGPDRIVISGGVAQAGIGFIARLQRELDQKLTIHKKPKIIQSPMDAGAGSIGAGLMAWERFS